MLLTDFCNHSLPAREPEERSIHERTDLPYRPRSCAPNAAKSEGRRRDPGAHPPFTVPKHDACEGASSGIAFDDAFPASAGEASVRVLGSETSSAGALHLVTALSAANEVARAQPLTPLSPATSRDDPEVIEVRRARTDSPALTSMRTKYPGSRRLPPTRRGPNTTLARRESNPCRETARLSRRGPHVRHMFTPLAKKRVIEGSGGARPSRGRQTLRLPACMAVCRLSTSAIGTNDEHEHTVGRTLQASQRGEPRNVAGIAGDHAGKSMINRVAPGQGHQRCRSSRCRFSRDRSLREDSPQPRWLEHLAS